MKKLLLLSVVAGFVMFIWGFISWAVLPWHTTTANKFTDEAAVSQLLKENAPQKGIYFLPFDEKDHGPDQVGAFASVLPQGTTMNMGQMMGISLATQIISAFLVLCLLAMAKSLSYLGKVVFFAWTGFMIGFVSHAPYWNWFSFSTSYTVVMLLDILIAFTLAGLVVGKFASTKKS